jgi:signal transduction histidine kinase
MAESSLPERSTPRAPVAARRPRVPRVARTSPMLHPAVMRSNVARSLDRSLICILCGGLLLAIFQLSVLELSGPAGLLPALFPLCFAVYVGAGLVAWYRRPSNRMGALILLAGMALYLGGLINSFVLPLAAIGTIAATLPLAVTIHLLLAFPSGRLRSRTSAAIVIVGYVTALVLQAPLYLFAPGAPGRSLSIADSPALRMTGALVQAVFGVAVMLATAVVIARRLVEATPPHRRVLIPLFSYGIVAVLILAGSRNILVGLLGLSPLVSSAVQVAVVGCLPIVFVLGILLGGFARTGQLEELGTWLGVAGGGERPALTMALAQTLGDPSLEVSFWVPERHAFVDGDGVPVPAIPPGRDRAVVEITFRGRTVAAISYNPALIDEPRSVRSAGRIVAIALERERLTAELRASRRALQQSRERLVDAADRERRRVARNLHDGLQMQLVLLAIEAQQLANADETSVVTADRATSLRKGIDDAAAALRALVSAVMPAALVERGLSAATEDLADRMPIPTELELGVEDGSCSPVVESTAYFVIAESLTNTIKYAGASAASVRVVRTGDILRVEVHDDGAGGATVSDGSGLRGLADRVDVLGGTMDIVSPPGRGTHIIVEVPCES